MLPVVAAARRRKTRRNCSPAGNRIENAAASRGEGQLFLVRHPVEARVQGRNHRDTARSQSRDKIAVHGVFTNVDLDLAHK